MSDTTLFVCPANNPMISIPTRLKIEVAGRRVTAQALREAVTELGQFGVTIAGHEFSGVHSVEVRETSGFVEYIPSTDTYRVWSDGLPVFESIRGRACKDTAAMADSLLD
jgi:hypothetical protein